MPAWPEALVFSQPQASLKLIATEGTGYVANSHFHRQLERLVLRAALPPWLRTAGVRAVWPLASTGRGPRMNKVREAKITFFCDTPTEEALVVAAKNGNDHAFEVLVHRYQERILTVALRDWRSRTRVRTQKKAACSRSGFELWQQQYSP